MKQIQSVFNYINLYIKSFRFVCRSSGKLTAALLLLVPVQALLPTVTLYLTDRIISQIQSGDPDLLALLLAVWGTAFIAGNLASPMVTFVQGQLTDQLTYRLNLSIMEQSERLQTIDHYEDSKFRDQISLLSSESSWRPVNLLVFGTSLMMNAISLVSMFMLLCSFQPVIAVLLFAALIPQGVLSYKIQQQAFETLVSNSEDSRKLAYYSETLLSAAHIKEVRLYRLYGFFQNKYRSAYRRIHASVQKGRVRQCVFASAFLILTGVVSVLGFCHIAYAVRGHRLDVGTILVYTSAIVYTIQGISRFVEDSSLLYDTLLYMSNLFSYLAIENAAGFDGTREWTDFGEMKVENLSFRYPQCEKQVLDEVSFSVKKGEKIAIVGENGAGKSTLVKLILRLYRQNSGTVKFDGVCFEDFEIESYRRQFGAVFQDFSRFDLTVRENVILSEECTQKTDEDVLAALRQSGFADGSVNDMVNDIPCGQMLGKQFGDSRELSGGQWQKLALARAFYRDADILILDEPTAALDPETEFLVFNRFMELAKDKTVLFVTHRMASVRDADKVLFLKDGRVLGFDAHEVLLRTNGHYREICQMQASMYQDLEKECMA